MCIIFRAPSDGSSVALTLILDNDNKYKQTYRNDVQERIFVTNIVSPFNNFEEQKQKVINILHKKLGCCYQ